MSSSVPGPHPEYHITFGCHVNLSISWLWQFLRLSLFCMNFTVLRCTGQVLFSMPLSWNLKFLLRLNCRCGIWGGKAHKVPLSSHQTRGTHHQHDLPLLILTLISCPVSPWLLFYLFIYLFLAVLGLRFYARAFSSCGKRRPLFITVRGPLTIAASLVAGHRLQTPKLSSCGSRA